MFTHLATFYPALGKEAELLAHATAFVNARRARGEDYALTTRLFSPIGTALTLGRRYDDLAAAEAVRATNLADPDFAAAATRANELSRAPATQRLSEVIVPVNATGEVKFVEATTVYPAPGHIGAIRSMLEERVRGQQARRSIGLAVTLYDLEGAALIVTGTHASLSSVEEHRRANQESRDFQAMVAEIGKLVRKPATSLLAAVVVGFSR